MCVPTIRRFRSLAVAVAALWSLGVAAESSSMGPTQSELDHSGSSADSWLMTNKSYDGLRYVTLDHITKKNVAHLKPVCVYDSYLQAPAESTPLLYEGRIYATIGQATVAVDAKTCKEIWRHEWALKGKALSLVNRGPAMKEGRLVRGTADGYLIALSMEDGSLLWEHQMTSAEEGHYLSMPAMIVDDLVIYGTAGADWGGDGWIGGFRLSDGSEVWRYAVLPEPGAAGSESWGGPEALKHGGGSFWTPVSVDRAKNIVFIPSGNPSPDFYGESRPGANLGTNSAIALDVNSGKVIWAKQFLAHDTHDWDLSQTGPLVQVDIKGTMRDLILVSGKDGRVRVVDRDSSETLYELVISKQENADKPATEQPMHICPGLLGGQEWSSTAFDPKRGIAISPMVDWCGTISHDSAAPAYQPITHFYGGKILQDPIDQSRGELAAIDVAAGKLRWKAETAAPMLANVTATSGGVIFAGDLKGTLYAMDSDNGAILLRYPLGASAGGGLFTYELGKKQYVAALSGSVSAFFGGGSDSTKITVLTVP